MINTKGEDEALRRSFKLYQLFLYLHTVACYQKLCDIGFSPNDIEVFVDDGIAKPKNYENNIKDVIGVEDVHAISYRRQDQNTYPQTTDTKEEKKEKKKRNDENEIAETEQLKLYIQNML